MKGAVVSGIEPGSIAHELGIAPGDRLLSINGHPVKDILDYSFLADDDLLRVELVKADGERWELEVEKDCGESLGIIFDQVVFDRIRSCVNRCLFCFVDQLPPGMRKSLYLKDDDYRLSFLYGNFISLTNLNRRDWGKILDMRLSPLYVSVHATDPEVRSRMFGSDKARNLMRDLKRLMEHEIEVHAQVVLCPGINDGECLNRTVEDLRSFWPSVRSVGIVPVGMTSFRAGLPHLNPVTEAIAVDLIKKVDAWQDRFRRELGVGMVYLADEFYVKAGRDFPSPEYYDDYPQIENGIGLATDFLDDLDQILTGLDPVKPSGLPVHVICGLSAVPVFERATRMMKAVGIDLDIIPVVNRYFGGGVTVTGLLTGRDIAQALGRKFVGARILMPDTMLRDDGCTLLDDMTVFELQSETGAMIEVVKPNPSSLLEAALRRPSLGVREESAACQNR